MLGRLLRKQLRIKVANGTRQHFEGRHDIEIAIGRRGQHWRKPVLFVAREDATIQPGQQTVLGISCREDDFEGLSSRIGRTTPVRDFSVMSKQFGVAYICGQDMDRIIVMNLSEKQVQIKAGTQVAEFHPRSLKDFTLLSTQGTPCDSIGTEAMVKSFHHGQDDGRHTLLPREAFIEERICGGKEVPPWTGCGRHTLLRTPPC